MTPCTKLLLATAFGMHLVMQFQTNHPGYGPILAQAFHHDVPVPYPWFRDTTIFYGLLGWFAPLAKLIGETQTIFLAFATISAATLYVVTQAVKGDAGGYSWRAS